MTSLDQIQQRPRERPLASPKQRRLGLPSLGLHASERKLLLAGMDVVLLNGALVIALVTQTELVPYAGALWDAHKWFITLTLLWLPLAAICDVYNLARAASTVYSLQATLAAAGMTVLIYPWIPFFTPPIHNRTQVFVFMGLGLLLITLWRALYARLFVQPAFLRRALVVGAGESGQALAQALQSGFAQQDANPFRGTGYELLGFIDDNATLTDAQVAGLPVWGPSNQLVRLARALRVDEVIVAITQPNHIRPALLEALLDCRELNIPVRSVASAYERLTQRVPVAYASQDVEAASGFRDAPLARFHCAFKRGADIFMALNTLLMLGLIAPLILLANRLTSPGPLFYRQQRVGQGGKPFMVIKFRSMRPDAEQGGAAWARRNDDRVTPVGRILRATHLDELPQVINVLRGEMSMVGPRPERPEFVGQLARTIPFYRARHAVKPGISGWAQVHQDYGDSFEAAQEKLEYDLYYIKHASPLLDLLILLRTVTKVIGLKGR